jgi:hypothetical protein
MDESNDYSDKTQGFNINNDYQTNPGNYNEEYIQNWGQLLGESSGLDYPYQQDISQIDSTTEQTRSFGFHQQPEDMYQYEQNLSREEVSSDMDYETIIRSKHLYYDPDPQVIRKSSTTNPIVYNQNIMIRFLQPPPIIQEPLIIREVRPPQPPLPPPLVSSILCLFNDKFLFLNRLFANELHLLFHHHRLFFENDLHQYLPV